MAEEHSLRDELKSRFRDFFSEQTGAWHDDGTFVVDVDQINELVPEMVDLMFEVMFVPVAMQDKPYEFLEQVATGYNARLPGGS